ncbi:MAG: hypothetical protein B6D62_02795 [Candidatus Cloacimonas sp. 4484_275]|nr:MAG: hypothetical protein B6D62_02795 [Candidatus Cloacimonas sp. 4484_275]
MLSAVIFNSCDVENVTEPDNEPPMVFISYPGNWDTIFTDEITIGIEAYDESGIDTLALYVNGNFIVGFTEEPFEFTLNKANFEEGLQTIHCKAIDKNGNVGFSELVSFYWLEETEQSGISVDIIRPILWEEFDSNQIPIMLNIQSEQQLENVIVFIDGDSVYNFSTAPYETTLTVNRQGIHNIFVSAEDVFGYSVSSEVVDFEIKITDTENPNGFISYPADWTIVSGTFDVFVSAVDDHQIDKVELFVDGELLDTISDAPYNFTVNSLNLENGNHTIYAKIYDTAGNFVLTQLITVSVQN